MRRRCGAALAFALVLLVVLECVVLGTLHLALQEHRIGSNRTAALRLRLEAESAVRRALGHWSAALDSMPPGPEHRVDIAGARSALSAATIERLGSELYLVRGTAHEPPPRVGRAAAQLLVFPPLIGTGLDPAPAPLAAAGPVLIEATAIVTAAARPGACPAGTAPHSVLTTRPEHLTVEAGASLDAPGGLLVSPSVLDLRERLVSHGAAPGVIMASSDTIVDGALEGILIVDGDLALAPNAALMGLVLSTGTVDFWTGSSLVGAVLARAGATISGTIRWDPCVVREAVTRAGLATPQPAGPRAWLPAF